MSDFHLGQEWVKQVTEDGIPEPAVMVCPPAARLIDEEFNKWQGALEAIQLIKHQPWY